MSVSKEHHADCLCQICVGVKGSLMERRWRERVLRDWGITGEDRKMAKPNDGGPAFPEAGERGKAVSGEGMSIRDYFAAKAMQAVARPIFEDSIQAKRPYEERPRITASCAYKIADAMIAESQRQDDFSGGETEDFQRSWKKGCRVQVSADLVVEWRNCTGVVKNGWRSLNGIWEYDVELGAPFKGRLARVRKSNLVFAGPAKEEK